MLILEKVDRNFKMKKKTPKHPQYHKTVMAGLFRTSVAGDKTQGAA